MGLPVFEPKGAFYIFPDIRCTGMTSAEFCEKLVQEEKVAVVPGTAFGAQGEGFVRISYAASMDTIQEALKRMARFVDNIEVVSGSWLVASHEPLKKRCRKDSAFF